jgi:cytosine/adenosine deaminase-related metal-dependent hydrolase
MADPVTLYRAAWVAPVSAPPLADGAVLVDGAGRIAAVGPRGAVEPPPGCRIEELGEAILLPGLVNVHAHPELSLFRGLLEDLPFREWIVRLAGAKRDALGDEELLLAARWTAEEAVRAGMTTVAATESSGAAVRALGERGLRGIVYQEVFGPDPAVSDASLRGLVEAVERLRRGESDLVRVGVSPHAPYTVCDALYRAAAEWAVAEGLPLATHAAESAVERALVTRGEGEFAPGLRARGIATDPRGTSTIELLDRLGVLRARPLLIHCVDLSPQDVERIAASGSSVAHCPVANARLAHGVAPLEALVGAGVPVGLGTDSVASNNRLDLLEEARFASLLRRALGGGPGALPPAELLRLCTLDGARALGLEERIGTLEPGRDADLCAVSLAGVHVRPVHDPLAALFHAARGSDVVLTAVRGRVLFRAGDPPPDADLAEAVEAAAGRLRSSLRGGG